MQIIENGRTYILTVSPEVTPALSANLLQNGWDGKVYFGVSKAVGRQRKDFSGMFYRSVKSGEFRRVL